MATFAINPATDTRKFTKILTLTHIFASIEQHHNTNAKVTMWKNWWNFLQLQIYSFAFVRGWAFSRSGQVHTQPDIVDPQSLSPKNPNIQFGSGLRWVGSRVYIMADPPRSSAYCIFYQKTKKKLAVVSCDCFSIFISFVYLLPLLLSSCTSRVPNSKCRSWIMLQTLPKLECEPKESIKQKSSRSRIFQVTWEHIRNLRA